MNEFFKEQGATRSIHKIVLVAKPISTIQIIRSVRKWCYLNFNNDRLFEFIIPVTIEDVKSGCEHIKMADNHVVVPSGPSYRNYGNIKVILDVVESSQSDSIWVPSGTASKQSKLSHECNRLGINFIGMSEDSMNVFCDKILSLVLAQSLHIPVVPWSGESLVLPLDDNLFKNILDMPLIDYQSASVTGSTTCAETAKRLGYPVILNCSTANGKRLKKATNEIELLQYYKEFKANFPGKALFVSKFLENSRHIKIHLVGDRQGHVTTLFHSDSTLQKNFYPQIEETPVQNMSKKILDKLESYALKIANHSPGAWHNGSVEFLVPANSGNNIVEDGPIYFLTVHPQISYTFPIAETLLNVNLAVLQLQISMGVPLSNIKELNEFIKNGKKINGNMFTSRLVAGSGGTGNAVGKLLELSFRSSSSVWAYFTINKEGHLHPHGDPFFGQIYSHAEDRNKARRQIVLALKEFGIRAEFSIGVNFLINALECIDVLDSNHHTQYLDNVDNKEDSSQSPLLVVLCGVIHLTQMRIEENTKIYEAAINRGQTLDIQMLSTSHTFSFVYDNTEYDVSCSKTGTDSFILVMNGCSIEVEAQMLSDGGVIVHQEGKSFVTYVHSKSESKEYILSLDGKQLSFFEKVDTSILRSPYDGRITSLKYKTGTYVEENTVYGEIEVMKMKLLLVTNLSGYLIHDVCVGAVLNKNDPIAHLSSSNLESVQELDPKLKKFDGVFNEDAMAFCKIKSNLAIQKNLEKMFFILDGWDLPQNFAETLTQQLVGEFAYHISQNTLPLYEIQNAISIISHKLPSELEMDINAVLVNYVKNMDSCFVSFPRERIVGFIDDYVKQNTKKGEEIATLCKPLLGILATYEFGLTGKRKAIIRNILQRYFDVEKYFKVDGSLDRVVSFLSNKEKKTSTEITNILRSHKAVKTKNLLVIPLLTHLFDKQLKLTPADTQILHQLILLQGHNHNPVGRRVRQILIESMVPSFESRRLAMTKIIRAALESAGEEGQKAIGSLIKSSAAIFDLISEMFFLRRDQQLQAAAVEIYIRRAYMAYNLRYVKIHRSVESDENDEDVSEVGGEFLFEMPTWHPVCQRFLETQAIDPAENRSMLERLKEISINNARKGALVAYRNLEDCISGFEKKIKNVFAPYGGNDPMNVFYCVLNYLISTQKQSDDSVARTLRTFINSHVTLLNDYGVRRVTFLIVRHRSFPQYYTFKKRTQWKEDRLLRHLEPALAFHLELSRMSSFDVSRIETTNQLVYLFAVRDPNDKDARRMFVRGIIREADIQSEKSSLDYFFTEGDRLLAYILDEMEIAFREQEFSKSHGNHIFLNIVPQIHVDPITLKERIRHLIFNHSQRLIKYHVSESELKANVIDSNGDAYVCRVVVINEGNLDVQIQFYREVIDEVSGKTLFHALGNDEDDDLDANNIESLDFLVNEMDVANKTNEVRKNEKKQEKEKPKKTNSRSSKIPKGLEEKDDPSLKLHMKAASSQYAATDTIEKNRGKAHTQGTIFALDFLNIFKQEIVHIWSLSGCAESDLPETVLSVTFVYFDETEDAFVQTEDIDESYKSGLYLWILDIVTPESLGRKIIVACDDITNNEGFRLEAENLLFCHGCQLARKEKLPFLYIASSNGVGAELHTEIQEKMRVHSESLQDNAGPFLYLTKDDYASLKDKDLINVKHAVDGNDEHIYIITDILGGKGMETLSSSAKTLREMSLCAKEIVTFSMVSSRAVGVNAFLCRLARRLIHVESGYMLLDDYSSLNKMLGKDIYSSNTQIGGAQVLSHTGISQVTAADNRDGVFQFLKWLSFIPVTALNAPPVLKIGEDLDPDRLVQALPNRDNPNPRITLSGGKGSTGKYLYGFCDKNSYVETSADFGKTVITARARLGGLPIGIIAVETASVEKVVPADPADPASKIHVFPQAGQVLYPDSSRKFSEALNDFSLEGLPVFIFANWRGFSGGAQDMKKEILKFGGWIVDALSAYRLPVFIYLPDAAELRGGAWAVVDPSINENKMEFYADPGARGGVLEPEGTASIKFRQKMVAETIERLDDEILRMKREINDCSVDERIKVLKSQIDDRIKLLSPIYRQAGVTFCDLQDTAVRMKEKEVIKEIIPFESSRNFFYWRLRRKMSELNIYQQLGPERHSSMEQEAVKIAELKLYFINHLKWSETEYNLDDKRLVEWLDNESEMKTFVTEYNRKHKLQMIQRIIDIESQIEVEAIYRLLGSLEDEQKDLLSQICKEKLSKET